MRYLRKFVNKAENPEFSNLIIRNDASIVIQLELPLHLNSWPPKPKRSWWSSAFDVDLPESDREGQESGGHLGICLLVRVSLKEKLDGEK